MAIVPTVASHFVEQVAISMKLTHLTGCLSDLVRLVWLDDFVPQFRHLLSLGVITLDRKHFLKD